MELSGLELFFIESFKITDSVSLLVMVIQILYFFRFSRGRLFLGIYPFLLGCPIH